MNLDPREIVRRGYDAAAAEYEAWRATSVADDVRVEWLTGFSDLVRRRAPVLELGCGGGGPNSAYLAERYALTGIDISASQVARARDRVPGATFIEADMTRWTAPEASFAGVAAFYSLIHLPQGELPTMLGTIAEWLAPGGVFVANFGARGAGEHFEPAWFPGVAMYWSGYAVEETMRFVESAGLAPVRWSVQSHLEEGQEAPFLWLLARKDGI